MDPLLLIAGLVGFLLFPAAWYLIKLLENMDKSKKFMDEHMQKIIAQEIKKMFDEDA